MDLIKYFKMGFQKYADFSTRSPRSEFWWFQLAYFLILIPLSMIGGIMAFIAIDSGMTGSIGAIMPFAILGIFVFGSIIPQLSIMVRRIHDTGNSGWMILLTMIPYIGSVAFIVFGVLDTQQNENKWGPVPESEDKNTLRNTLVDFDDNDLV